MNKQLKRFIRVTGIGLGLSLAALSGSGQAAETQAAGRTVTQSVTLSYGDLNLADPAGAEALYARIEGAARRVCAPEPDMRDLTLRRDWHQCRTDAVDNAVAEIRHPALEQVHATRTGRLADRQVADVR